MIFETGSSLGPPTGLTPVSPGVDHMKRYIGISLLLIVVLIVAGCGGNKRIVKERPP